MESMTAFRKLLVYNIYECENIRPDEIPEDNGTNKHLPIFGITYFQVLTQEMNT